MKQLFSLASVAVATVLISSPGMPPSSLSAAETIQQRQPGLVPKHVNAEGADKLLKAKKDVVVLDIRTADEFSDGHLIGAKNIDFCAKDFSQKLGGLDKDRTYLVHCAGAAGAQSRCSSSRSWASSRSITSTAVSTPGKRPANRCRNSA